jgi:hypothetical protein
MTKNTKTGRVMVPAKPDIESKSVIPSGAVNFPPVLVTSSFNMVNGEKFPVLFVAARAFRLAVTAVVGKRFQPNLVPVSLMRLAGACLAVPAQSVRPFRVFLEMLSGSRKFVFASWALLSLVCHSSLYHTE